MGALSALPENYKEIYSVHLQKDKKTALLINLLAVAIAIVMVIPMQLIIPISTLFSMEQGMGAYLWRFGILAVGSLLYILLHEAVHGLAMKFCGSKKIRYGFTGLYAFAGSDDYYDKSAYIFIALAPVVLWGIVLAVVQCFVPAAWAWVVYIIQISNLSGAAGDYFVTAKFSRMPADILVRDSGVGMKVYSGCL